MTGGAVSPLRAPAAPLLLLPPCDTVSVTLITLIVAGSLIVNKAAETFFFFFYLEALAKAPPSLSSAILPLFL